MPKFTYHPQSQSPVVREYVRIGREPNPLMRLRLTAALQQQCPHRRMVYSPHLAWCPDCQFSKTMAS